MVNTGGGPFVAPWFLLGFISPFDRMIDFTFADLSLESHGRSQQISQPTVLSFRAGLQA